MPEQAEYFDKYIGERFRHIEDSMSRMEKNLETTTARIEQNLSTTTARIEHQISEIKVEVKEENRTTRKWLVTTAISLMIGFTAIAVSIFFGFSKLQTTWIQTVISFVGKTIP
jgi:type VI protein secretion system component VasF